MNDEHGTDDATVASEDEATVAAPVTEQDGDGAEGQGPDATHDDSALDRKLTRENASLRKRLREIEAQVKAREEAEMTEQERSQRRMVEIEQELEANRAALRETRLRAAIAAEAPKLGIVDVDAATRLLDTSALDYEADTGWEGVGDALRDLTHERPWLVSTTTAPAADANTANPARRRSRLTVEQMRSMTQAEIDALPWEDVQAALSQE